MAAPRHVLPILLVVLSACASRPQDPTRPRIDIAEVVGPRQMAYATGDFDVQFELFVANPGAEPITLRRVELVSTPGGAYTLRRGDFHAFNEVIAPGTQASVKFWSHVVANYYPGDIGSTEPVSIRGVATFSSPRGNFREVFTKVFSQFAE
jgi:hypothetical protein